MVSEKDLQSYLKVAASALPCREARKEFSSYVHIYIRIAFLSGLNNQISGLYISCDGHILLQILLFDLYLSIWHLFMLGHRRLNFFRYFVSNDLNINYLLCNLNRYVVDISIMG